jgi:hypothetical protein
MTYSDVEQMTGMERDKMYQMLLDYLEEHPPGLFG